ncbi:MAG: hypothetical protein MAG715_01134 [Methanonatronarchaeales archaeon]|nr:hypothetical protein [Methanonatronarchaeales archaeon]
MGEVVRKLLHVSGAALPFLALRFGPVPIVALASLLAATYLAHEAAGLRVLEPVKRMDPDVAPLEYLLSASILLLLPFHPGASYATVEVLALGDGLAGLVGSSGKRALPCTEKTVEGSAAGFAGGLAGSLLFLEPRLAVACAGVGTVAEAYLPRDNLTVPFAAYVSVLILAGVA